MEEDERSEVAEEELDDEDLDDIPLYLRPDQRGAPRYDPLPSARGPGPASSFRMALNLPSTTSTSTSSTSSRPPNMPVLGLSTSRNTLPASTVAAAVAAVAEGGDEDDEGELQEQRLRTARLGGRGNDHRQYYQGEDEEDEDSQADRMRRRGAAAAVDGHLETFDSAPAMETFRPKFKLAMPTPRAMSAPVEDPLDGEDRPLVTCRGPRPPRLQLVNPATASPVPSPVPALSPLLARAFENPEVSFALSSGTNTVSSSVSEPPITVELISPAFSVAAWAVVAAPGPHSTSTDGTERTSNSSLTPGGAAGPSRLSVSGVQQQQHRAGTGVVRSMHAVAQQVCRRLDVAQEELKFFELRELAGDEIPHGCRHIGVMVNRSSFSMQGLEDILRQQKEAENSQAMSTQLAQQHSEIKASIASLNRANQEALAQAAHTQAENAQLREQLKALEAAKHERERLLEANVSHLKDRLQQADEHRHALVQIITTLRREFEDMRQQQAWQQGVGQPQAAQPPHPQERGAGAGATANGPAPPSAAPPAAGGVVAATGAALPNLASLSLGSAALQYTSSTSADASQPLPWRSPAHQTSYQPAASSPSRRGAQPTDVPHAADLHPQQHAGHRLKETMQGAGLR